MGSFVDEIDGDWFDRYYRVIWPGSAALWTNRLSLKVSKDWLIAILMSMFRGSSAIAGVRVVRPSGDPRVAQSIDALRFA